MNRHELLTPAPIPRLHPDSGKLFEKLISATSRTTIDRLDAPLGDTYFNQIDKTAAYMNMLYSDFGRVREQVFSTLIGGNRNGEDKRTFRTVDPCVMEIVDDDGQLRDKHIYVTQVVQNNGGLVIHSRDGLIVVEDPHTQEKEIISILLSKSQLAQHMDPLSESGLQAARGLMGNMYEAFFLSGRRAVTSDVDLDKLPTQFQNIRGKYVEHVKIKGVLL